MGDGNDGAPLGELFQRGLDHFLRFGIERRGRLIKQQDRGRLEQGACNGDPLLLASGEQGSLVSHECFVAVRLGQNELMRIGETRGLLDLLPGGNVLLLA